MALAAGQLKFTLEYAKGLKDKDLFGRQDPYAKITCGSQFLRSKTHIDGGKNPVWNQTFTFNIINENSVTVDLWDEDTLARDDRIGQCVISLATVRQTGRNTQQVPVMSTKSGKQHGFISVSMTFTPNQIATPPAYAPQPSFAPYGAAPPPYQYQPSFQYPPAPAPYYAPAPSFHQPQPPAPAPYYAQAPSFHAPPPPAPAPYYPSPSFQYPPAPPPAPSGYGSASARPPSAGGGYYPSLPTQQQFYPGAALGGSAPPPPIRFS